MLIAIIVLWFLYLLPTFIAAYRHKVSLKTCLVLNASFGWTGIGWILCLAWALSGKRGS